MRHIRGGILHHEFQGPEAKFQVEYGGWDHCCVRRDEHPIVDRGYDPQPVRLEQDNQSCITLLTKGRSTAEREIRKFWISDYIKNGEVDIVYVPTAEMTSDYFTKPLQGAVFDKMFKKIMGQE